MSRQAIHDTHLHIPGYLGNASSSNNFKPMFFHNRSKL